MFFSRTRSLLLIVMFSLFFDCGGNKLPVAEEAMVSDFPARKAYVVIRSEGGPGNVQRVRNILSTDFSQNNVRTEYSLYRAKQSWNQNEIFNTAYNGQYDYIVLIDQVAKVTIDNSTHVGGKYQIRSYHIKSPNPNWLDLGQATCNLTVVPSIQKFSREVIRSIVGNKAIFIGHDYDYNDGLSHTDESQMDDDRVAASEMSSEIETLRKELAAEKERTRLAEIERKKLEDQLKHELEVQKQKAKIAQIEAEEAALKNKQREREIAEEYKVKRETIRKREAEEALMKPVEVVPEQREPTREERISRRAETKRRIAAEKAAKRKEMAEAAAARKEERRRLEQFEKEERRRLKEEIEAQRKEKQRLAEEDLKRIREKVAEERRQAEALAEQQKEAERLATERLKEEQRQAEQRQAELEELAKIDKEQADALAKEQRKARRIAREEEARRQEAELKSKRKEEKRLAKIELAKLQEEEALNQTNEKKGSVPSQKPEVGNPSPNAFVVIRGKSEEREQFEDLDDLIQFDFMFVKAKARIVIVDKDRSVAPADIKDSASPEQDLVILIDQEEYLGEGKYRYAIKSMNAYTDTDWTKATSLIVNLNLKSNLKQLSKKITEHLPK